MRLDDLMGNHLILTSGEQATVGRAGSFPVGQDDLYLHRLLFQVWYSGQGWLLGNRGSHITLYIQPRSSRTHSQVSVGPGAVVPLPIGPSAVVFSTPERSYELHIDVAKVGLVPPAPVETDEFVDATHERYTPNEEQQILLDLLAEPLLRMPGAPNTVVPSVQEVADHLGWTLKKTNQKIERLALRLGQDGENVEKPYRVFLAHYAAHRRRR